MKKIEMQSDEQKIPTNHTLRYVGGDDCFQIFAQDPECKKLFHFAIKY